MGMGAETRRIPLPAPTDVSSSALGTSDDLATDISRATDRTSYSIPEDGSPVTITTKRIRGGKEQSQTSLLIEYFEGSKTVDGVQPRPSVRVRVTPSSSNRKKSRSGKEKDHIQITETGRHRKPSYTRRISLPQSSSEALVASDVSDSSSGRPPVEVEVLQATSDVSQRDVSPSRYYVPASDVSSMPADSLLESSTPAIITPQATGAHLAHYDEDRTVTINSLQAPTGDRDRSVSRDRLAQSAMKKIQEKQASSRAEASGKMKSISRQSSGSSTREYVIDETASPKTRSRRSSERGHLLEPSEVSAVSASSAAKSSLSARSNASSINNPKLLSAVEDAIKRLILPELTSMKEEQARVKEEQARQKNRMKFEDITRDSMAPAGSRENLRRVSKSSSSPNVGGKAGAGVDERGVEGAESIKSRKTRRSSRGSEKSHETAIREESSRRSSREHKHGAGKVAAGALAAGALTAAALRHHDSIQSMNEERERRKKRSKSRSRSASLAESTEEGIREKKSNTLGIPALPNLQQESAVGTDITRDSILSAETDRPHSLEESVTDARQHEIKHVSTGSPRQVLSPEPRTPTRTPDRLLASGPNSVRSEGSGGRVKRAVEELTVAQHDRVKSLQSQESLSSGRKARHRSNLSVESTEASPQYDISARPRPRGINLERPHEALLDDPYTPESPAADTWFEKEHERNEQLRREYEDASQVDSNGHHYSEDDYTGGIHDKSFDIDRDMRDGAAANPEYVHTPVAVESAVASLHEPSLLSSVHSSQQTESLHHEFERESNLSHDLDGGQQTGSSKERWEAIRDQAIANARQQTSSASPRQSEASLNDRPIMGASAIPLEHEKYPEVGYGYDNDSEITTNPSIIVGPIGGHEHGNRDHWPYDPTPAVGANRDSSNIHEERSARDIALGTGGAAAAVGLGLATARSHESAKSAAGQVNDRQQPPFEDVHEEDLEDEDALPDAMALQQQFGYASPNGGKGIDEGYISGAVPGGELTPDPYNAGRNRAIDNMSLDDLEEDDPFTSKKRLRYASGLSHGMASPLYDAATGKGIDRIKDRDVVALMDHLTVRDAHRNAKDTEILVTLVRTAAEMRNHWEDMKKFMQEQDRMVMAHTDRAAESIHRAVGGPRPYPNIATAAAVASPRAPRRSTSEDTDDSAKSKKNLFRRAFKSLGSKNQDLTKIEDMLIQLLGEVEFLKQTQMMGGAGGSQHLGQQDTHTRSDSLGSYNDLRTVPDPGYDPEGMAGTSSSPAQSAGHLSNQSSKQIGAMHSGFDARRSSEGHRISTVPEGDEEDEDDENWTPNSAPARDSNYANNGGMLTPTQEVRRQRSEPLDNHGTTAPLQGSKSAEETPVRSVERKSKHKSGGSWLSGKIAPISRWSKTTASTFQEPPANLRKNERPYSHMSHSGSDVQLEHYDEYNLNEDDQLRSRTSLENQARRGSAPGPRSPSPLIPEARKSIEDPKYQAHRNSLNLQHPQPRQGPTHRHQTYLETQAIDYGYQGPESDLSQLSGPAQYDQWGNTPALALNKLNRFSGSSGQTAQTGPRDDLSPVHSEDLDAYSEHSASEQAHNRLPTQQEVAPPRPPKIKSDEGPLVPPKIPIDENLTGATISGPAEIGFGYHSPYSNSGMHIASPLEPIEEVRYSLETDRSSVARQNRDRDLTPSPRPTAMQSVARKITGPRDMPPSARKSSGNSLTVPRKPVNSEYGQQQLREKSPGEFGDVNDGGRENDDK